MVIFRESKTKGQYLVPHSKAFDKYDFDFDFIWPSKHLAWGSSTGYYILKSIFKTFYVCRTVNNS